MRTKPVRYWIRDEIEDIIKEYNIDRNNFYEYSKFRYKDIIQKFADNFVDRSKTRRIDLNYCWLNLKKDLQVSEPIIEYRISWTDFLRKVREKMPETDDNKFYMILSEGWVYEGFLDEIFAVLNETTGNLEDFYIVSRKFDWFVCYCSDGDAAVLYSKL
ncbi:MAG: hypothetical protein IJ736_06700 [Firmicutes bacterium]|nr:hypothetical protein [Bacillota bacterium]